ncbi:MAG: VOC family protein [Actinobacteria bacterium]|jgi:catechol 2,3-dioxygenase-like lactoylglutathione lyase family enzyme|nr:VOC family protein [Actinomycetota bacterium]
MKHAATADMSRTLLGHVGITTPDLDASLAFYADVFGFRPRRPVDTIASEDGRAAVFRALFGPGWAGCRMTVLAAPLGPDLELFEFVPTIESTPAGPGDWPIAWRAPGPFHVSFPCGDVQAVADRVTAAGGTLVSDIVVTARYELCYATDPFGTVIELQRAVSP